MTKTATRQKECTVLFQNEKKFTENFPGDIKHNRLRNRFFDSLPEVFQSQKHTCWEESEIQKEKLSKLPVRRHSWSSGSGKLSFSDLSSHNNHHQSQDSRKSSTASIPEIIEECSSDDEHLEEETYQNTKNAGLRCRNCFQIDISVKSGGSNKQNDKNLYCKKCMDLINSKSKNIFYHPINIHDLRKSPHLEPSARRIRKSSLPETDLPSILEPKCDDEANDTKEMQMIVEEEVNKLLNFNKGTSFYGNNGRRNSDNDVKLLMDFRKMMMHKKI